MTGSGWGSLAACDQRIRSARRAVVHTVVRSTLVVVLLLLAAATIPGQVLWGLPRLVCSASALLVGYSTARLLHAQMGLLRARREARAQVAELLTLIEALDRS